MIYSLSVDIISSSESSIQERSLFKVAFEPGSLKSLALVHLLLNFLGLLYGVTLFASISGLLKPFSLMDFYLIFFWLFVLIIFSSTKLNIFCIKF